jgi:transposase InsO family protein
MSNGTTLRQANPCRTLSRELQWPPARRVSQRAPVLSLRHACHLIAAWRDDYNHHRPHTSLDGLTPREFLNRSTKDETLNRTSF